MTQFTEAASRVLESQVSSTCAFFKYFAGVFQKSKNSKKFKARLFEGTSYDYLSINQIKPALDQIITSLQFAQAVYSLNAKGSRWIKEIPMATNVAAAIYKLGLDLQNQLQSSFSEGTYHIVELEGRILETARNMRNSSPSFITNFEKVIQQEIQSAHKGIVPLNCMTYYLNKPLGFTIPKELPNGKVGLTAEVQLSSDFIIDFIPKSVLFKNKVKSKDMLQYLDAFCKNTYFSTFEGRNSTLTSYQGDPEYGIVVFVEIPADVEVGNLTESVYLSVLHAISSAMETVDSSKVSRIEFYENVSDISELIKESTGVNVPKKALIEVIDRFRA